ncbi:protein-L-isoaspartate(D-aspartate) O-methyltransferase [Pseudoroseomonas rhizosphaerae]|uniref:Protein-L-isoaspartate O-methyltransferase n=1 Tax=Teichococcus rhizosphaerae TaxID=1335062 RepID=A0A2C7AJR1_9PROT|nr:protein-L-isoaspartate O-methyltransferase [Pseudoroseomonas rhizosphaerae]PHK97017.1 protein-L-isoaspartate(D-aspartate) O-methyltransferase [Pseudoroseomonas rhizosphaerae]
MDFAGARKWMVDGQLRPNKVTDPRIISAMLDLPRHRFVPQAQVPRAHADEDVPLGGGRVMIQPMMLARLMQLAQIRADEQVLLLGAGSGYGAALAARMGGRVTAVESDPALLALARDALDEVSVAPGSIRLVEGDASRGHAAGAPYDLILIEGQVPEIPAGLVEQLAEGGRAVAVRRLPGQSGAAVLGRRLGGSFSVSEAFDCNTAPLPDFLPQPGFVF